MKKFLRKFTAAAKIFRMSAEACRIKFAEVFEPYAAVHSSRIEPLPHQISAVYEKMLPRQPLRFVLADDPGAGKTIMAGLLIKELIIRRNLQRCLIVCPKILVEQWQEELQQKFLLNFEILTGEKISAAENIFAQENFCIASVETLARQEDFKQKLQLTTWDLIICDEAHKMAATIFGNKPKYTKRFRLGQLLGKITRNFLLLTATPHNGKEKDFYLFMSLIDADRFAEVQRITTKIDASDLMRRLVKEDLLKFDGSPLFPERIAYTVNYSLSPEEISLYNGVTNYVADGFNRAEKLSGDKRTSVGFAMTILQRRLASSPMAIFKSLQRRTERLKNILQDKKFQLDKNFLEAEEVDNVEEFSDAIFEDFAAEQITPAQTISELKIEIETLEKLTEQAKNVFYSGNDKKWQELSSLLQDKIFARTAEKLIIFTEHRDTLEYLQEKINALFDRTESVIAIHGGLNFKERRNIQDKFKQDEKILILLATDAAGEGINLQNAHLMINYDLPWNPNRLEQRFGRIHRIGQKKICCLWNLVANETREGQVFKRLLEKLENERRALGGKVFDILGKISFDNKPLRDLLIEAVRFGSNSKIFNAIDNGFDTEKLLQERALTQETFSAANAKNITLNMECNETLKLQPYCIENFFVTAFRFLGGQIDYQGGGLYQITRVPAQIPCNFNTISFDKNKFGNANFISLGHPLLNAVTSAVIKNCGETLRQGTIFIDDNAQNFRLLLLVETAIQTRADILSKRLHFIEISADGKAVALNQPPYFDCNEPTDDERKKILAEIQNMQWLDNAENIAANFAQKNICPAHLQEISSSQKIYLDKLEKSVRSRLNNEIDYLDNPAIKHKDRNAAELVDKLNQRLSEIRLARNIFAAAPVILGGALIVPRNFINSNIFSANVDARTQIENIAMHAVFEIEKSLGNIPTDCTKKNCGYDVQSFVPAENFVRFIEVKGRNAAADTVTVTVNEILTAFHAPDNFILAIVTADKNCADVVYLKKPFTSMPDLSLVSANFKISALRQQAEILLERKIPLQNLLKT